MGRAFLSSLLVCGALVGFSEPAAAYGISPLFTSVPPPAVGCAQATVPSGPPQPLAPAAFTYTAARPSLAASKSAAILGGASALDRIRMNQAATTAASPAAALLVRAEETLAPVGRDLAPGSGPVPCNSFILPHVVPGFAAAPSAVRPQVGSDDFLQTRRLSVSHTAFDRQWSRVSRETLTSGYVSGNAALRGYVGSRASEDMLGAVNAWTNHRIRFVEDARLFGQADYWAGARKTLKLGAGDCEDIAITKLQLLAALGVPRSDMYLTVARDLARRADHAVLVVRLDGRYWLLDNGTDRLLDAAESYDYQPVLSFSEGHKWLHGAVLAANY